MEPSMGRQDQRGEPEHTHHELIDELLSTKLAPPRLNPNFIPRQALLARLNQGLEQKLTLVSAPAGFGKTALVSSWLQQVNQPAAWLSLDEDDNHFTRFWTYFIAALQTIQPAVGNGVLAMLQVTPIPHSHTLLTLLLNDLANLPDKFLFVLDDYHNIELASVDQALAFFIDHLPPTMHLVIISRVDPNLPLARLRANGQLNELRSADLRFSPAETTQFLEQMTGLNFSAAEVAALDRRTEGWIAGLLRLRLHQTHPDRVASLHFRASQWYEQAGFTDPAVQHALEAEAFDRAANLMIQAAPRMIQRSELARLLAWFDTLPGEEVQARPRLSLYYSWGLLLSGQIQQAAALLDIVDARLAANESELTPEVQSQIAAMRAYLVRETGDFDATIALSSRALAHLPVQDTLLRAMATLNLAIAYYLQGELEQASQLLTENITAGQTDELMANTLSAIYLRTQIMRTQGALQQALELCQEGLALVNRHSWQNFPAAGFLYVALGNLLRDRNELKTAEEYLEKGVNLGQEGAHPHIMIIGYVWLAWLRQTLKNTTGSQEAIQAALQVIQQYQVSRFWPLPAAECCQARLWIAQGNLTEASLWAQTSGLNPEDTPVAYFDEAGYLVLARVLIARGDLEPAEALLRRLHKAAESAERYGSLVEILILQAIPLSALKRGEEALSALDQALSLAEPEGFVRIFLDEGAPVTVLLRQAVAQGLHASYALRLLNALGEVEIASQPLIEPLSERELEVLRRVAAGYSNQEIAQDLVLAVSTVKKHINNIYGKLGVGSRTQAVARARELELL
jgi:LuxR family maltose regulon positive regulatory protein